MADRCARRGSRGGRSVPARGDPLGGGGPPTRLARLRADDPDGSAAVGAAQVPAPRSLRQPRHPRRLLHPRLRGRRGHMADRPGPLHCRPARPLEGGELGGGWRGRRLLVLAVRLRARGRRAGGRVRHRHRDLRGGDGDPGGGDDPQPPPPRTRDQRAGTGGGRRTRRRGPHPPVRAAPPHRPGDPRHRRPLAGGHRRAGPGSRGGAGDRHRRGPPFDSGHHRRHVGCHQPAAGDGGQPQVPSHHPTGPGRPRGGNPRPRCRPAGGGRPRRHRDRDRRRLDRARVAHQHHPSLGRRQGEGGRGPRPRRGVVEVTDDGKGSGDFAEGHGIRGMRERAEALGGRLEAGPLENGGFRVAARIPR